jgi:hypothetical protein
MDEAPRWARITRVGPKVGPVTSLGLKVHYDDQRPFWVGTVSLMPRHIHPSVGQDVYVRRTVTDDHTGYVIDWSRPPQYGARAESVVGEVSSRR